MYQDPSGHFAMLGTIAVGGLIGAATGFIAMALKDASMPVGQKLTAQDYAADVLVGAAAGALIGSGVGIGAGTELGATLFAAGVGGGTTAGAYTATSGAEYNSGEMAVNAGIGVIAGAGSGFVEATAAGAGFIAQAGATGAKIGLSVLAGEAQQITGDAFDGNWSNRPDLTAAGMSGGFAYGASVIAGWLPVVGNVGGKIAGPLVRSALVESGNNIFTSRVTTLNNRPTPKNWQSYNNACWVNSQ